MDLLKDEVAYTSKRYAASTVIGNNGNGRKIGRILDTTGDGEKDKTTTPMKTETNVSCLPVFSVTHISYRINPELTACVSVCLCETNTLIQRLF
jgi:hypothetical protein